MKFHRSTHPAFPLLAGPVSRSPGRAPLLRLALLLAGLLALLSATPALANSLDKFAGTYRIDGWKGYQDDGMFHFFYLHPSGVFLLAAQWEGNETSTITGTWSAGTERLYLTGSARVDTNQGKWVVEFSRTFQVKVSPDGYRLTPLPEKNRFGLMGWPNAFDFYRRAPQPNLPGRKLPGDEAAMLQAIQGLQKDG